MLTAHRLRKLLSFEKTTGLFRWLVRPSNRVKIGAIASSDHVGGTRKITIEGRSYLRNRLAVLRGDWPLARKQRHS